MHDWDRLSPENLYQLRDRFLVSGRPGGHQAPRPGKKLTVKIHLPNSVSENPFQEKAPVSIQNNGYTIHAGW
jgi:hypothetical protein